MPIYRATIFEDLTPEQQRAYEEIQEEQRQLEIKAEEFRKEWETQAKQADGERRQWKEEQAWLAYKEGELEAAKSKAKGISHIYQAVKKCLNELNHFKTLICKSCEKREAVKQRLCHRCWAMEAFQDSGVFREYSRGFKWSRHLNRGNHMEALEWAVQVGKHRLAMHWGGLDMAPLPEKPKGLFLHGPTGGGKTRTASEVLRTLTLYGCRAGLLDGGAYSWMKAEELQAMNQENKSTPRWIEESGILDCWLLLIDDIDHRITPTFPTVVYRIMDARINDTKGVTILTSNQSLSELKNHFGKEGPPIVRRIHENFKVLHFSNGAKLPE